MLLTRFQTEISANLKFCHLGIELPVLQGSSMRFGHPPYSLVAVVGIEAHPIKSIFPSVWTISRWMPRRWGVTFRSRRSKQLLLPLCAVCRVGSLTSGTAFIHSRCAHIPSSHQARRHKTISGFLSRPMDRHGVLTSKSRFHRWGADHLRVFSVLLRSLNPFETQTRLTPCPHPLSVWVKYRNTHHGAGMPTQWPTLSCVSLSVYVSVLQSWKHESWGDPLQSSYPTYSGSKHQRCVRSLSTSLHRFVTWVWENQSS